MSFPPLAGGDHTILSSEFCSGYVDTSGVWNTGFYCPQTGSVFAVYCCGTPTYKYCCTTKPVNGTGAGVVEDFVFGGTGGTTIRRPTGTITENGGVGGADHVIPLDSSAGANGYSGATRMRPSEDLNNADDLSSLNLSDVPIIFGVACGVAAVLILVILVVFYLTSCCAHYHKLAQNRKRRSSMTGIYRGVTTANSSTTSGLVNLYSPTHSVGTSVAGGSLPGSLVGGGGGATTSSSADNTQTYIVHHHHHNNSSSNNNPPGSPDSSSPYHLGMGSVGGGGSASLVTSPLDIEWSSTTQYLQKPQQAVMPSSSQLQQLHNQQPLNLLSNHLISTTDNRIHYTVHQTQNRLAVALTGSMNRLSDHGASSCPNPASSSYPVNIPLTPPDGYNYPRQIPRGLSPPPQYSSSLLCRAESPPYFKTSYDNGGGTNNMDLVHPKNQQYHHNHNYLSRTSTLPLSLARKPPSGAANRSLITSPVPYAGSYLATPQQPKSILRTSENFRRVVTNETPPPIPPHSSTSTLLFGGGGNMEGSGGGSGSVAYRSVDSRTNLCSQSLLILESKVDNKDGPQVADDDEEEDEEGLHTATLIRRSSFSTGVNASSVEEEEEEADDEKRDQFDMHDIDSDALSRLLEIDCDSKL